MYSLTHFEGLQLKISFYFYLGSCPDCFFYFFNVTMQNLLVKIDSSFRNNASAVIGN